MTVRREGGNSRPFPPLWRHLEALAWVRWRDETIVPYLGAPGARDRWRAAKFYPSGMIAAPGLEPRSPPTVICPEAESEFERALQRGHVDAFADDGEGTFSPLNPANFHLGKISPESSVVIGGVVHQVFFEAQQVKSRWPEESLSLTDRVAKERQVEAALRPILAGLRPPGMNKKKLWEELRPRIPWKAYDEMFRRLAKELKSPWNRAGRPPKSHP
jgi:hypothetical protein